MSSIEGSGRADDAPLQRAAWIDGDHPAGQARVGEARLVKGGAKVSTLTEDVPVEAAVPTGRGRVLSEAEIAESGLLRERVFEIGELREEAVVSKQAVIREELVVRREVAQRSERIADTVRRTEVEVERLEPRELLESDGAGDSARR